MNDMKDDELTTTTSSSSSSSSSSTVSRGTSERKGHSGIWIEKYRPQSLDDVLSHQHIISTINRLIDAKKLPHLLFYGPAGTGKTSTILACARRLYGESKYKNMILELNASDDRGISVVREEIITFASTRTMFSSGVKLIILDEADSMTKDAQAALRRVMEKYTRNVRFCLICNYVSRIIPALQSRCTRFRFAPLPDESILPRLEEIIKAEKVDYDEKGLQAIVNLCGGDMRKCLNVLQAAHMAEDVVTEAAVYRCTGNPTPQEIDDMLETLLNDEYRTAFTKIHTMMVEKGFALSDIVSEISFLTVRIKFETYVAIKVHTNLAEIEYNLSKGCCEKIQLAALVGLFQLVAKATVNHQQSQN